ncbi:aminopeptidase [Caldimonas thermodepolymerans]|jgi:Predicted aminopeptidase|uniref:Aminopeptidase n=1 Tax=Caldimonas thermodepolymerans TaxID=215580 RepID=A0A2S5T264_9BURK|nr:aminopeptidase [Caldimonas thermodepolymerans]PPE68978.1 aminopeptidase [Caldimonas thermodepolymerans]QPC32279.1 aminopeptidase [Caldimonas thermodepolymerans]RDH98175.1 putative aminopeptidase [Caldimonas thermodepolymerans]TCP08049.1 putative aminopeptidase [Caldimonas thermodepolymerans]UZG45080.1 aminopeptidase [Caldimonas thermodepolymerans]
MTARTGRPRTWRRLAGRAGLALAGFAVAGLAGCGSVGYLAQSVRGHFALLGEARPVAQWLDAADTPQALRERLALSQRIRDFAVSELKLPDNGSYRRYADLGRPAAVWNVVAAPELSLELKTWCFPVAGCVGYRGYFDQADAEAMAAQLRAEGYEVAVYGVPAYSTLGWFDDPLLNTFIHYPEGELARLIFHELAHQVAYAKGDTTFNESFATAVERLGVQRWLETQADAQAREEYARFEARRQQFRTLTLGYREQLQALYRSRLAPEAMRRRKAELMQRLRDEYETIKREQWGGFTGYDAWFERANNASLGVLAAYHDLVPAFERLFEAEGRDFARFYAAVGRLARLPQEERRQALLQQAAPARASASAAGR